MHFDYRNAYRRDSVADSVAVVRVGSSVEDNSGAVQAGFVQAVDESALGIALEEYRLVAKLTRLFVEVVIYGVERFVSVDVRLAEGNGLPSGNGIQRAVN